LYGESSNKNGECYYSVAKQRRRRETASATNMQMAFSAKHSVVPIEWNHTARRKLGQLLYDMGLDEQIDRILSRVTLCESGTTFLAWGTFVESNKNRDEFSVIKTGLKYNYQNGSVSVASAPLQ